MTRHDDEAANRPSLLPGVGGPAVGLTLAILHLSLVAALGLTGLMTAARSLEAWPARLSGSVTLAATASGIESADAAAARAAEILGRTPGVARAEILEPAPGDGLAARIMGAPGGDAPEATDIELAPPTPRLLKVVFAPGAALTAPRVTAILAGSGLPVAVDDHGVWSGPLERGAFLALAAAAVILFGLLLGVWGLVAMSARRSVARHGERIGLLIHLGATEPTLIRPFRRGLVLSTVLGVALGVVVAAGAAAILVWSPQVAIVLAERVPDMPAMAGVDLLGALLWPLVGAPVGALAAAVATKAALRRMS